MSIPLNVGVTLSLKPRLWRVSLGSFTAARRYSNSVHMIFRDAESKVAEEVFS